MSECNDTYVEIGAPEAILTGSTEQWLVYVPQGSAIETLLEETVASLRNVELAC